jgi:MFS family permease
MVLVETMFYSVLAPLLPYYVEHLGLTKAGAGTLSAFYAFGAIAFAVPAGFLVARVGVRPTVLTGVCLLAASSVTFGFARDLVVLDAARFVQGAGGSCLWAAGLSWLVVTTPEGRRSTLIGAAVGIGIGGALLGPVLGGAATLTSPELVFTLTGALIGGLGLVALMTPAPPRGRPDTVADLLAAAREEPRLRAGILFTFLPSVLFGVLEVLAPLRLTVLGASTAAIAAIFLVCTVAEATMSPLVGQLADRRGAFPVARLGLAACAGMAVVLPLPGSLAPYAIALVAACVAFGWPWVPASAMLSAGAAYYELGQGVAFGLWNLAWAGGQAIGSAGGAGLAEASSDAVPYLLLGGLCALTLLAGFLRGEPSAEAGGSG